MRDVTELSVKFGRRLAGRLNAVVVTVCFFFVSACVFAAILFCAALF